MPVSIFTFLAFAIALTAVVTLGAGPTLRRRVRRPRLPQGVAAIQTAIFLPANVYCALSGDTPLGRNDVVGSAVALVSIAALCAVPILFLRLWIPRVPARLPRRVLAVGAHPDDLELGCGATLAKLVDSGHEVRALVMTDGREGGHASRRHREAARAGRFLGAEELRVESFPDTRLAEHTVDLAQAIEREIYRFNPDIIFTHSANDQHQDHLAVHEATLRAARQHSTILCYESPSATRAFEPRVFVDIEDYVGVKVAAVGEHRDQRSKPYMTPERIHGLAVYRGSQAKVRHAEGYEAARLLGSALGAL